MGQLTGIFQFQGTVGQVTVDRNGRVRQKAAPRPVTSPRVLENGAEFGAAATAGKLLRDAFRSATNAVKSTLTGEVTAKMRQIIGLDAVNDRGIRQVLKANIGQLLGFNFTASSLASSFYAAYTASFGVGANANKMTVDIPSITPTQDLAVPQGATHFQIVAASAAFDFAGNISTVAVPTVTAPVAISAAALVNQDQVLTYAVAPAVGDTVITVLGVNYFQEVNGDLYPLNNGAYNALTIVAAE